MPVPPDRNFSQVARTFLSVPYSVTGSGSGIGSLTICTK